MPFPINTVHRLALEDGTSLLLLEDNTSKVILDETIALDDPLNGATVTTLTPGLTFVGENIAGNNLTYEVEVDTVNTFDSVAASTQDSHVTSSEQRLLNGGTAAETNQAVAQSIMPTSSFNLASIDLKLWKSNSPVDNVSVSVHTSSQIGTTLGISSSISGSTITAVSPGIVYNFTFSVPIPLSSGVTYYFVIERSGANDTTNHYNVRDNFPSDYSSGTCSLRSSNIWTDDPDDIYFVLYSAAAPLLDKTSDLNTGFTDDATLNADDKLLLETGNSGGSLLLEDNSSHLIINYSYPQSDYITYTVPGSTLSNSTTYYWRARQKIQNGGSYPVTWSEIRSFTISISVGGAALSSTLLMMNVG